MSEFYDWLFGFKKTDLDKKLKCMIQSANIPHGAQPLAWMLHSIAAAKPSTLSLYFYTMAQWNTALNNSSDPAFLSYEEALDAQQAHFGGGLCVPRVALCK